MDAHQFLRSKQGTICTILDGSDTALEALTVELFSAKIIDELTKNDVLRKKGYSGANTLIDSVRSKLKGTPQKLWKIFEIMCRHEDLCSVVNDMLLEVPQSTLEDMETHLLKTDLMVKPLQLEKWQQDPHQERFPDRCNPSNKSIEVLHKYSQQIVSIIYTRDIAMQFARSLCEARLIAPAMIDQVEKIENKLIQAKTIMIEVRTIIKRGVIPKMLMEKFIGVLYLEKFQSHFKAVIEEIKTEDEGYEIPNVTDGHYLQNKVMESISDRNEFPPLQPLTSDCHSSLQKDPYHKYLHLRYHRPKHITLCSSPKEWKFFDLAATEQSVTKTNTCGEALDLRLLPQNSDYPPRTLIIGAPGVGKSSIIIELCKRWVNGDLLQEYEYVIHLRACDPRVRNAKCLSDFVPEGKQEWLCPIKDSDGDKSLFIIDGYDELSEECRCPESFIDRFIQGEVLGEAAIIVTTRPWCAKQISSYFPNEGVEILGFTPQSREKYIRHFLKDDADDFLSLQQRSAAIEVCSSIPFYLATLIEIFKEKKLSGQPRSPLTTVTKVYGALIVTLMLKFVRKHKNLSYFLPQQNFDIAPGEFFKFPMAIYEPLLQLCTLSYNSLSDPASLVPELGSMTFDLLNEQIEDNTSGRKCYYKFLHSSIEEYLAAYRISRMESGEMEQCICNLKQSKRYNLVLEFLHGFGCTVDAEHYKAKQNEPYRNFDIFRQLCEAESCDLIRSVYKSIPNEEQIYSVCRTFPSPTPADFWCLGKVIALSDCDWDLGFTLRPIENNHLKMLHEGIQSVESVERPTGRIRKMCLSLTNIDQNGLCHTFQMNKTCLSKLQEIQLFKNHLTVDVIPLLCASFPKLPNFRKFLFHYNEIQAGGHKDLILALAKCRALEHLTLTGLLPEECQLLLTTLKCLKVIEFWRISAKSCKTSFDSLADSNVEQLQIYDSHINPTIAENLPQTLPASKVRHLKLINCAINCETVRVIVTAAEQTRGLQSIDLSDNCIEDEGGDMLLLLCWRLPHLKLLDSYKFNDFSPEMCKKLKKKNVYDNCFSCFF